MLGASSKSKRRWVACLAAGLLLFTQLAMAAQACMLAKPAPQQAMAMEGCEGIPMDKGVCLARCVAAEQPGPSLDQHVAFVAASADLNTVSFPSRGIEPSFRQAAALPAAGPPLRVLYCSYQI